VKGRGTPTTPDPGLEGYLEGIEAGLRARRGVEHVLSPREFALARAWHEAGIPLATVLVAIDLAFDSDPSVSSLVRCRRRVEQLATGASPTGAAGDREAGRPDLPDLADRLAALREQLRNLPARAVALPLQEVAETADLVAVASRPNWAYLESRLRRIDDLVSAAAVEALGPGELERLRADAERAAGRHRGHVDSGALEEAKERLVRQRARERLQLPRVGVF
jgi:hypothetical protein